MSPYNDHTVSVMKPYNIGDIILLHVASIAVSVSCYLT